MASAAAQVLPVVLQGDYRADGAFRALSRDITTAQAGMRAVGQSAQMSVAGVNQIITRSNALTPALQQVGHASGFVRGQMANMGYQINDVVSGLLMGQSPFMILAQQGGQVYQILSMHQGGVGGALKELKGQILGLITPGRALVLGFTAAAGAAYLLYRAVNDNGPTAEKSLEEHARLLDVVKDAYRDAAKTAGEFYNQSKAITTLQAQQNLIALQNQLRSAGSTAIKGMTTPTSVPSEIPMDGVQGAIANAEVGATAFRTLNSAIEAFNASTRSAQDVVAFRDAVAAIGVAAATTNPELAKAAAELLNQSKAAGELALSVLKAEAALRVLQGTASKQDRELLGLSTRAAVNGYDTLIQRTKDRIAELRLEGQTAGQTGNAVMALKLQHDAERAAKEAGVKVNQKVLDQLKEELVLASNLTAQSKLRAEIGFERQQLGRTESEQRVAETLRSARIDLNSAEGQLMAQELRINEGLRETRDLAKDVIGGLVSDLRNGATAGEVFANVLNRIGDRLANIGVEMAASGLMRGLGGIFNPTGAGLHTPGGFSAAFPRPIGFNARGTDNWRGGWSWVGEEGPELVRLPRGAQVRDARSSRQMSGSDGVNVSFAPVYNVQGSGPEIDELRAQLARDKADFEARVTKVVREGRRKRTL